MSNLDEKRINRLYKLLERLEAVKDKDTAATLRWAIFTLEQYLR